MPDVSPDFHKLVQFAIPTLIPACLVSNPTRVALEFCVVWTYVFAQLIITFELIIHSRQVNLLVGL